MRMFCTISIQITEHLQKQRGTVTHTFYHFQFPNGSIQRFGDAAKALYQPMGDLIGIPPGYTVKQKHFQYLMLPKTVQSKFFISGFLWIDIILTSATFILKFSFCLLQ